MTTQILIGNDNLITVDEVKNAADGTYINTATVTCTLKDLNGTEVTGQAWPLTLPYVSSSNGKYQGTLEDGLVLVANNRYIAYITIDAGSDLIYYRELDCIAKVNR